MGTTRLQVVGVPVDCIEMDAVLSRIAGAARDGRFFQISTVNLDFLVQAQRDREVGAILRRTALNILDGAPVVWLARLLGADPIGRVAGADLVGRLLEMAEREDLRVLMLGGENGTALAAADRLRSERPKLRLAVYEPPRTALEDMDHEAIFRRIDEAKPQIVLVAFGHPKQEKWIYRHRERLPMVAIGVGCSLDLIAGRQGRAPEWMQQRGLEWAYRVAHEPRRLARRYALDALWLAGVFMPMTLCRRLLRPQSTDRHQAIVSVTRKLVRMG